MKRLIDVADLEKFISEHRCVIGDNKLLLVAGNDGRWQEALPLIKTAYDIDKVVEELKAIKEDALAEYNMGEYNHDNNIGNSIAENYRKDMNEGRCFAYDDAIEIVKVGGKNE